MKQRLIFLTALLLSVTAAWAWDFAYEYQGQNLYFDFAENGECTLASVEGYEFNGEFVLPAVVTYAGTEYTVTRIGDNVFEGSSIELIVLPNTLEEIGWSAFWGCGLTEITIPENVVGIGSTAFAFCGNLRSVTFAGTKVPNFGYSPFANCPELMLYGSFVSDDHRCVIDDGILKLCNVSGLETYTIPESVKRIGDGVFAHSGFKSIVLPNTLEEIGYSAFWDCGLTEITIPENVVGIGSTAFGFCGNLRSVTFAGTKVPNFGSSPFTKCPELLLYGSFVADDHRCVIDDGILKLCNVSGLETYTIPESVTRIGEGVFAHSGFKSIVLPNTLEEIGPSAFWDCGGLTEITIPENVVMIGVFAFGLCGGLESVTIENPDPTTISADGGFVEFHNFETCTLYVPAGTVDRYRASECWGQFTNIMEVTDMRADLIDGTPYTKAADKEYASITYTRTFTNTGWQALYIPFDMEYADWAELGDIAKLNNVHQYDTDGDGKLDKTTLEFNLVTDAITANTPYVFRPKAVGEVKLAVSNATLKAAPATDAYVDCSSTETVYTIYGNYAVKEGLHAQGAYALSPAGQFVQAESTEQTLNPYRIYMIITDKHYGGSSQKAPARITISVDGEITGIDDIEIMQQIDDRYYDLMGRPVENPQTGIYIRGGEKVYIK